MQSLRNTDKTLILLCHIWNLSLAEQSLWLWPKAKKKGKKKSSIPLTWVSVHSVGPYVSERDYATVPIYFSRYGICQAKLSHSSDRQLDFSLQPLVARASLLLLRRFSLPFSLSLSLFFFFLYFSSREIRKFASQPREIRRFLSRRGPRSIDAIRRHRLETCLCGGGSGLLLKSHEMTPRNGCSAEDVRNDWNRPLVIDVGYPFPLVSPSLVVFVWRK